MLKLKIKVGKTQLFLLKTRARKKTRKKKYYVYKPSKKSLNVNVDNIYYHFDRNIFQFHKKKIILNNF